MGAGGTEYNTSYFDQQRTGQRSYKGTSQSPYDIGSYVFTAADASNGSAAIGTGIDNISTALVQVLDSASGVDKTQDAKITWSASQITITDSTNFTVTSDFTAHWFVTGS